MIPSTEIKMPRMPPCSSPSSSAVLSRTLISHPTGRLLHSVDNCMLICATDASRVTQPSSSFPTDGQLNGSLFCHLKMVCVSRCACKCLAFLWVQWVPMGEMARETNMVLLTAIAVVQGDPSSHPARNDPSLILSAQPWSQCLPPWGSQAKLVSLP